MDLLRLGQQALSLGEPDRAAKLLAQALNLWRGDVLDDLGQPDFASTETARSTNFGWSQLITASTPISRWASTTR